MGELVGDDVGVDVGLIVGVDEGLAVAPFFSPVKIKISIDPVEEVFV